MAPPSANSAVDTATLELLQGWRLQDATDNPEEVRAAEQELTEFKRAMNESRTLAGEPLLY
jgi:ribosomal protein S12 methylthiotransferase accessory factor YcaO